MGKKLIPLLFLLVLSGCGAFRPIARQTTENRNTTQINANTGQITHIGYSHSDWKRVFDSLMVTQMIDFVVYDTLGRRVSEGRITTESKHTTTTVIHDTIEMVVTDTIKSDTQIRQEDYTKKKTNRGMAFLDKVIILAVIVLIIYVLRIFRHGE